MRLPAGSETRVGVEAANRWADNVDVLRKWAAEKFAISSSDFDKSFEIESDLDYIDEAHLLDPPLKKKR
jgi:hypothetical protein